MNFSIVETWIDLIGKILPFLWQEFLYSSIMFGFIWLVTFLIRKRTPRWHYALWFLVLIRLTLPPDFSHQFSARNMTSLVPLFNQIKRFFDTLTFGRPNKQLITEKFNPVSLDDPLIRNQQNSDENNFPITIRNIIYTILLVGWLAGMTILLIIYFKKLIVIRFFIKQAYPVSDKILLDIKQDWCAFFKVKRPIRIVCSDKYLSPFTYGIFKPVIFLPAKTLLLKNREYIESIIAHEISHIKRQDNLWLKFQNLIQIVYFFNPIVWIVNSKINLARECICDRMVLSKNTILNFHKKCKNICL